MTTIAYKDRWLVSDSQVTVNDNTVDGEVDKIFRTIDGAYYAFAGNLQSMQQIIQWLGKGGDKPKIELKVDILKIHKGKIYMSNSDNLIFYQMKAPYVALGSGYQIALGAMAAGATAEEAVKIAKKIDIYTGGKIKAYHCS